jgi:hypothetical protein
LVRIDCSLLAGWSWGLAAPFPKLALEVGHVGLVGELVQVRERSFREILGTRIERAVHVGAHGKQGLHHGSMYATRCLDSFVTAFKLSAAPDLVAWTEGYCQAEIHIDIQ